MERYYHVLNGDSLKEQFPKELKGQLIVARECLVDGEVKSDHLEDLFQIRSKFIAGLHPDYSIEEYYSKTVSEFEKIKEIPNQSTIHLWFEDDLFCQVNFWFVVYLIHHFVGECKVFLIRPKNALQYGFGGLSEAQLIQAFEEKIQLLEIEKIASLWGAYQSNDLVRLTQTAKALEESFPFILPAVEAHIARIPTKNKLGRPVQSLVEIIEELETEEFGPVFSEFNKRESIYGFGDVQVKRLFDEIKNSRL
jgi:hypothetical protein